MKPTIHTEKHYSQKSVFAIASGAITNLTVLTAAEDATAVNAVRVGSKISAVYVEMWLTSDDATQGSVICTLEKLEGGMTADMSAGNAGALTIYANKKNIFHTQMGLLGPNTQYPLAVIKGWFKIPKSKQRFGLNDRIKLNIFAQSNGVSGCGFFLYKEQY